MIAHVDILLAKWARWAISSEARAVGYPPTSPMFKDSPSSGVYASSEPFGLFASDFKDVTRAVDSLPILMKHCVIEYYQRNGGADAVACRLGIKKAVMFKYLHSAHEHISQSLAVAA